MSGFAATVDGRVIAHFDPTEIEVLSSLSRQFSALVARAGEPSARADPAISRLFPDAYRDDVAASAEFRRYTRSDLASAKLAAAQSVQSSLDELASSGAEGAADAPEGRREIALDEEHALAWMRHLTDVRLTLGARMGVVEADDELDDRPEAASEEEVLTRSLFDWVGYVQELLIAAVEDATAPASER